MAKVELRCLLIMPNFIPWIGSDNLSRLSVGQTTIPLGLGCIGTQLEKEGYHVKLVFANEFNLTQEEIQAEVKSYEPDVVGITCSTGYVCLAPSIEPTINTITLLRRAAVPSARVIILGGLTYIFEKLLLEAGADVVIRGEPELKFLEIIQKADRLDTIKGIGYRDGDRMIFNEDDTEFVDLNKLPPINYHLFLPHHLDIVPNPMTYDYNVPSKKIVMLETNRGCPFHCIFCLRYYRGQKVRHKSIERVMAEINYYHSEFGVDAFNIPDNTFTINRAYVLKFCNELRKLPYRVYWRAVTRIDCVDSELLKAMKRGVRQVCR